MRTAPNNVAAYLATQPPSVRKLLARVRGIIRKALPGAEETISYQIPTYKLHGKPVIYLAAFKAHYSVYPSNARLVKALKDDLERYQKSKGTIRFPLSEPVPVRLIERIAKFRAKEVVDAVKPTPTARKKR